MSDFKPPYYLKNKHIQTLFSNVIKPKIFNNYTATTITLPDNDVIEVMSDINVQRESLVILIHGLEGSAQSSYIQYMAQALLQENFDVCIPQFRSCGMYINNLSEFYHAGETKDLAFIIEYLNTLSQ